MIKRYNRNICYRYAYGTDASDTCTWVEDCTARDAAVAAALATLRGAALGLKIATENYNNAVALVDNIVNEQKTVDSMLEGYDNAYQAIQNAGPTFSTQNNCNILIQGCSCIEGYAGSLADAHTSAINEMNRCESEMNKAQAAYDQAKADYAAAQAAPCDSKCV